MSIAEDVLLIAVGLVVFAVSRLVADNFKFPGQPTTWAKAAGMGDDYVSSLTRWVTCVLVGIVFIAAGIIDLAALYCSRPTSVT